MRRLEDMQEIDRSNLPENNDDIPELTTDDGKSQHYPSTLAVNKQEISKETAYSMLRNMNKKQSEIFYYIRNWCLEERNNKTSSPFRLLVHGGGGCGKNHLIKCIEYEATQILKYL